MTLMPKEKNSATLATAPPEDSIIVPTLQQPCRHHLHNRQGGGQKMPGKGGGRQIQRERELREMRG
jgi:hypothetical protein